MIVEFLYIPRLGLSSSIGVVSFPSSGSWDMIRGEFFQIGFRGTIGLDCVFWRVKERKEGKNRRK
jgi:hypothetical protein